MAILLNWVDLAYWWSCIRKGLPCSLRSRLVSKCSQANNSVRALSPWPWRKFESTWTAKDTYRGDWIRRGLFRGEKNKQDVVAVL